MRFLHIFFVFALLRTSNALPSVSDLFKNFFSDPISAEGDQEASAREKRQTVPSGSSEWVIETQSLPIKDGKINSKEMPVLANGYLGTTVYSDKLFISGLYAGAGSSVHRAVIPPYILGRIYFDNPQVEATGTRKHYLDAKQGISVALLLMCLSNFNAIGKSKHESGGFRDFSKSCGVYTELISTSNAIITHRTYVHKKYIRIVVMDVHVRWMGEGEVEVKFNYTSPEDLTEMPGEVLWEELTNNQGFREFNGRHRSSDVPLTGQPLLITQTRLPAINRASGASETRFIKMMGVDIHAGNVRSEFQKAYSVAMRTNGGDDLLREHVEAWQSTWDDGYVHLSGTDLQERQIAIFSQFYLISSMPSMHAELGLGDADVFYGDSRSSMGKGAADQDYQGHRFWDTEMYMNPAVLMFRPNTVKKMLQYRTMYAEQAQRKAEAMGASGYCFPWESAKTGEDVTPDTCKQCRDQQIFVSGAISFAIRQYLSVTNDKDFMTRNDFDGCGMSFKIAEFYQSIAKYNHSKARYDISHVMGPDDWHPNVDNSAVVNVLASLAIHWARYMSCVCNVGSVPDEWLQKALYLDLPFDNVKRMHYPFEGYDKLPVSNQTVKQADAIMLTFPISWNTSVDIMYNDLLYYETMTPQDTPAMTWSFFTVGYKFTEDYPKMENAYLRSYQGYTRDIFKVWTEYPSGKGSSNYLPGAGGYIQSLIFGFAGLRIRPQMLEFHNPTARGASVLKLNGFKYMGVNMTILISQDFAQITVHNIMDRPMGNIILKRNQSHLSQPEEVLLPGVVYDIEQPRYGFYMYPEEVTSCEHPRDYIYMPWGYSPFINAAPCITATTSVLLTALMAILYTQYR